MKFNYADFISSWVDSVAMVDKIQQFPISDLCQDLLWSVTAWSWILRADCGRDVSYTWMPELSEMNWLLPGALSTQFFI
jgi:hypothetical protein